jgi:hypothetical protein
MKKTICLLVLLSVLPACTDEFLEEKPESFLAPQTLYTSEAGALAGLSGAYNTLQLYKGGRAYLIGIIGTDEAQLTFDEAGVADRLGLDAYDGNLNSQNPWVAWMWNAIFFGVDRANNVLQFVPAIQMDEMRKSRILGEARFLRAVHYFHAVQLFGPVPLQNTPVNTVGNLSFPRASVADVYNQIIADLQFAEENLPPRYTAGNDRGRATSVAAKTLLAKVYLTAPDAQRNYQAAAAKARETIDLATANGYGLETDYAALFDSRNENGKESIFEFQFQNPDIVHALHTATGTRALPTTVIGGGFAAYLPTDGFYRSYLPQDKRLAATYRTRFFRADGTEVTSASNPEYLKPYVRKYEDANVPATQQGGKNTYYLRYADLLLMYAEALNESGQPGQALAPLNLVRHEPGFRCWKT